MKYLTSIKTEPSHSLQYPPSLSGHTTARAVKVYKGILSYLTFFFVNSEIRCIFGSLTPPHSLGAA